MNAEETSEETPLSPYGCSGYEPAAAASGEFDTGLQGVFISFIGIIGGYISEHCNYPQLGPKTAFRCTLEKKYPFF